VTLCCDPCDFCDVFAGRLILSHNKDDEAGSSLIEDIRMQRISHVSYLESMTDRLHTRGITLPAEYAFHQHLLGVPAGEELWKINFLRFHYQQQILRILGSGNLGAISRLTGVLSSSNTHMLVVPDSALSVTSATGSVGFAFDATNHTAYCKMLGLPNGASTGAGVKLAIIDTGLDPTLGITASSRSANCSDDAQPKVVDDVSGHGSVVASIIHNIVPDAEFTILKIGDQNPIPEWNVLSALIAAHDEDVVNMSLSFGLATRDCYTCGRHQTSSSRSAVFEQAIGEQLRLRPDCVLVAAAGNRNLSPVDFPARFGEVVTVGAVDSSGAVSSFPNGGGSNYGTTAHGGAAHDFVFFAPGGGGSEYVATTTISGAKKSHQGTSFAAPYAAALFAHYLGDPARIHSRQAALDHFITNARSGAILNYSRTYHGHGLIHLP
jgi:subtilase family protein